MQLLGDAETQQPLLPPPPAEAAAAAAASSNSWQALQDPKLRPLLLLALALPLLQQASGINTVIYYSTQVFASAGLHSPIGGSALVCAVNLAVTLAAAPLLDR